MRLISFQQIASSVRLYVADNFIDVFELEALLRAGTETEREFHSGDISQLDAFKHPATAKHDATGFSFEMRRDGNCVLNAISARMEAAFGFANGRGGSMHFRRYYPGEFHPLHYDNYELSDQYLIASAMLWLTDTESGGQTRFPYCIPGPLILEPRAGRLAIWLNYCLDGSIDRAAMHEALPVVRGSKTTLTNFFYGEFDLIPAFSLGLTRKTEIPGLRFEEVQSDF
jgi:2OG-Fe(II) oxygenase superfamily